MEDIPTSSRTRKTSCTFYDAWKVIILLGYYKLLRLRRVGCFAMIEFNLLSMCFLRPALPFYSIASFLGGSYILSDYTCRT